MPKKQYRGDAAEFRCQLPAEPVLVPGIPLPDGSTKSIQGLAIARLFGDGAVNFGCRMRISPRQQGEIEDRGRSAADADDGDLVLNPLI
jgi:hypothetical protein